MSVSGIRIGQGCIQYGKAEVTFDILSTLAPREVPTFLAEHSVDLADLVDITSLEVAYLNGINAVALSSRLQARVDSVVLRWASTSQFIQTDSKGYFTVVHYSDEVARLNVKTVCSYRRP